MKIVAKESALQKHSVFMFEKLRNNLLEPKSDRNRLLLRRIDLSTLRDVFGYSDSPRWNEYIIDLDSEPLPEYFDPNNPLYKSTPRIFKTEYKDTVHYGIEKLARRRLTSRDFATEIEAAAKEAFSNGITVNREADRDIYIIEEMSGVKIKFARFSLLPEGGTGCE